MKKIKEKTHTPPFSRRDLIRYWLDEKQENAGSGRPPGDAYSETVRLVRSLIALLALPWAVKAMQGSKVYHDRNRLVQALGDNVKFILLTQVLLGVGYILAKLFPLF